MTQQHRSEPQSPRGRAEQGRGLLSFVSVTVVVGLNFPQTHLLGTAKGFGAPAPIPSPNSLSTKQDREEYALDRMCPCHSGSTYGRCCHSYHDGGLAPTAEALLLSRYSAFSLQRADYIMRTTHESHKDYDAAHPDEWKNRILSGLDEIRFVGLSVWHCSILHTLRTSIQSKPVPTG